MSHNTIEKKEVLTPLNSSTVEKIEIRDNPFVKGENYREEIFDILPNIVIVDDQTKSGQEVDTTHYDEEEEEYIYEDEYRDEKEDDYNDDGEVADDLDIETDDLDDESEDEVSEEDSSDEEDDDEEEMDEDEIELNRMSSLANNRILKRMLTANRR